MSDGHKENIENGEIDEYFDKTVLNCIKRRKDEKKSCTLKGISEYIEDVDESQINLSLQRLEGNGEITKRKYGQSITYNPTETLSNTTTEGEKASQSLTEMEHLRNDLEDFKRFVTASLTDFSSNCEFQKNPYQELFTGNQDMLLLKSLVEGKDEIVNLLKDEIKYLREQNTILINQRQNHCCVSESNFVTDANKLKRFPKDANSFHIPTTNTNKSVPSIKNTINSKNDNDDTQTSIKESNKNVVKKKVIIIGDSIIGGLNKKGMQNTRDKDVKVKCHPGATTGDLIDHLNPELRKKPDVIILHGGTNDLSGEVDTIKNLTAVASKIRKKHPHTKLVISSLTMRRDKQMKDPVGKVNELNKNLVNFCVDHNLDLIKHNNIKEDNLSPRKLHLNKSGSSILAKNFLNFIENL